MRKRVLCCLLIMTLVLLCGCGDREKSADAPAEELPAAAPAAKTDDAIDMFAAADDADDLIGGLAGDFDLGAEALIGDPLNDKE